jgi:hypothetical protein
MSDNLQLFKVLVTQEWSSEAEALVWAPDLSTAEKWAEKEVEFDIYEAEDNGTWSRGTCAPVFETLQKTNRAEDLWLIAPDPHSPERCNTLSLEEFKQILTPERLEELRIASIEKDNGQLSLLTNSAEIADES